MNTAILSAAAAQATFITVGLAGFVVVAPARPGDLGARRPALTRHAWAIPACAPKPPARCSSR